MKVTTGTYDEPSETGYAGWIEGTRVDGTKWIMWLDENGSPAVYYAQRDIETGAIIGDPVELP
jgi:hypothetical protein